MPLDSTIPQETPVVARQIGGRAIQHDSELWKTLFPSELLRIDGRVPVENSSKFLLQMRMNVTKELIAVAFSPASESNDVGFRILNDFLIAKGWVFFFNSSQPVVHFFLLILFIGVMVSYFPGVIVPKITIPAVNCTSSHYFQAIHYLIIWNYWTTCIYLSYEQLIF